MQEKRHEQQNRAMGRLGRSDAFFSALTLSGRWLDLALALTVAAVFWYGIVPEPSSSDNSPKAAKSR